MCEPEPKSLVLDDFPVEVSPNADSRQELMWLFLAGVAEFTAHQRPSRATKVGGLHNVYTQIYRILVAQDN